MSKFVSFFTLLAVGITVLSSGSNADAQLKQVGSKKQAYTVTGEVHIIDVYYGQPGEACNSYRKQYRDLKHGTTLTVKNGRGEIIATANVPPGVNADAEPNARGSERVVYCLVTLQPFQVPKSDFYVFSFGQRGELTYSFEDMERNNWQIELSIGGN